MSARFAKLMFAIAIGASLFGSSNFVVAQANNGNNGGFLTNRVVGGVKIDATGAISKDKQTVDAGLRQMLEQSLQQADNDINVATKLRMISLRGLETAITAARDNGQTLPSDVQFMAGLQRIEYIILSPENNDILLAGPGEGWRVDEAGNVVGNKSGTPVIHLEDFLVATRSTENARTGDGISVSIDPTEAGIRKLQAYFGKLKSNQVSFNPSRQTEVEQVMGPQQIRLTGVPTDSRFSQVLVAADYKMKRLSMGLEPAPIEGLPSFMEIAKNNNARIAHAAPRFWMECSYQPVAKTADGSVWQVRGSGVKALTQESHFDAEGKSKETAKQNKFAVQWANLMTEKFEALSSAEPAFRELRNVMDLSVIAAIIRRENLATKVGLETPAILGLAEAFTLPSYNVPSSVPTECSFVRLNNSWLVSASGGVQLDSWGVAQNTETVAALANVAQTATQRTADRWWWNAKVK